MIRLLALFCCLAWLTPTFAAEEAGTRTILLVRHGEYDACEAECGPRETHRGSPSTTRGETEPGRAGFSPKDSTPAG